jgi:uncharacterized protein
MLPIFQFQKISPPEAKKSMENRGPGRQAAGMAKPKLRDLPDLSDLARPGTRIAVRVTPKASRASLIRDGDNLRARVTTVPQNGKANAAVLALLAAAMNVAPSHLRLVQGQTARNKIFVYSGTGSWRS